MDVPVACRRFLLRSSQAEKDIAWDDIQSEELEAAVRSAQFDIDYLAVLHLAESIFELDGMKELVGGDKGKLYKRCVLCRVTLSFTNAVLAIGEIGDYRIGIPVRKGIQDDGEILSEEVDDQGLLQCAERDELNSVLESVYGSKTYREIVATVSSRLARWSLLIYQYGQKTDLEMLRESISKLADSTHLELALAMELSFPGRFPAASSFNRRAEEECYSVLFSNDAVNMVLKSEIPIANAYRLVVYNTVQHTRKKLDSRLKLPGLPSSENVVESLISLGVEKSREICRVLTPAVGSTKLRVEVYFRAKNAKSVEHTKILLENYVQHRLNLLSADSARVSWFLNLCCQLLTSVSQGGLSERPFSRLFCFLELYCKYVGCIFSTSRLTNSFVKENRGLGLPRELFAEGELTLLDAMLNQYSLKDFVKYRAVFKKGLSLATLLKSLQTIELFDNFRHQYLLDGHIEELLEAMNQDLCKKGSKEDTIRSPEVNCTSFDAFLEGVTHAMRRRGVTAGFLFVLLSLIRARPYLTLEIEALIQRNRLVLRFKGLTYSKLEGDIDCFAIVRQAEEREQQAARKHFIEAAKKYVLETFTEVCSLDDDAIKRVFTTKLPLSRNPKEYSGTRLACCFPEEEHFIRFIAYLMVLAKNKGKMPPQFKSLRDHTKTSEACPYTSSALVYATGLFRRATQLKDPEKKVAIPLPKRCDFLEYLSIYKRLQTWEPVLTTSSIQPKKMEQQPEDVISIYTLSSMLERQAEGTEVSVLLI